MHKSQTAMAARPIFPLLLSMSLPVMLSMLIQALYNIVDSYWVAKLGTDALTAVSLAFPLQNVIMSVAVGMGIGISAQVSIYLGQGDHQLASRAASLGTFCVLGHCLVFLLAGFTITKPFLSLFTSDPAVLSAACDYTRIVLCLSFGEFLQMCLEKIFQGAGKMLLTMFLMASGCIINMILDPILIFGLWGFPAMGIRGAALATVIGQICGMVLYLVVYPFTSLGLHLHPKYARWDIGLARRIYGVSIPSSLMLAMPSVLTGLLNAILTGLGGVYVAILGLYFKLQTFVNMPANGIVQGMRPIIGYNYGAGNHKRVRTTIWYGLALITLISAAGTALAVGLPGQILGLFDAEPTLLAEGSLALRLIGPSFLLSSLAVVACGVLEALGMGRASLRISLLRQLVILVPLGWALSRVWGAAGIWIAFPLAELVTLAYTLVQMRRLLRGPLA